jgi:hypothetical protein
MRSLAVNIGVDFGTSASVVYFSSGDTADVKTEKNAVHLDNIRNLMYWLGPVPPEQFDNDGWFFPRRPEKNQDRCLIPSALWIGPCDQACIRWAGQPPGEWATSHAFKWDDGLQDRSAQRRKFLQEVAFFSIPLILEELGNRKACPQLRVGFAYPLAFSFEQRNDYCQVLDEFKSWLQDIGGFSQPTITSLNESLAAVRAYAEYNRGEQFLIADMGGRTLDVALFSYAPEEDSTYHQIGSLDFGGEIYLSRVTASSGQTAYWELRQAIFAGQIDRYGANREMIDRLDRFQVMALEYVRTMLACHRVNDATPVKVILIGNGWRLRDLTRGGREPNQNFRDYFERMLRYFGTADVVLLDVDAERSRIQSSRHEDAERSGIQSSKHWVAVGALKWAASGGAHELKHGRHYEDRLPAGRKLRMAGETFEWNEMVGLGGRPLGDPRLVRREPTECDLGSGPFLTKDWQRQLNLTVPDANRYPDMAVLRDWLHRSVHNDRLLKGPLQLILEKHWKGLL